MQNKAIAQTAWLQLAAGAAAGAYLSLAKFVKLGMNCAKLSRSCSWSGLGRFDNNSIFVSSLNLQISKMRLNSYGIGFRRIKMLHG